MSVEYPISSKERQAELRNTYFEEVLKNRDFRLREVIYDDANRPISLRLSEDKWTFIEATVFAVRLCGGVVITAEEKIQGLR